MRRKIPRVVRTIALIAAIGAGGLGFTGCGAACTVQSRILDLRTGQTLGGTEAALGLRQTRGSEEGRFVMWFVRVNPLVGTVGQVRLRAATGDHAGRVLYEFPLVNAVPAAGVVTQVFEDTPYQGAVPFAELWDLLQRDQAFVEVIDAASTSVLRIGPLELRTSLDWQDVCT